MNNKACDGVINVISLSLFLSLSLFCVLSAFSLPLTSDSSDLSLLFFFFSHLFPSHSLPLTAHGEASLFSRLALGGWASDRHGWLQIEVGGFRLAWVAEGAWVALGSWVAMDGHGFCC